MSKRKLVPGAYVVWRGSSDDDSGVGQILNVDEAHLELDWYFRKPNGDVFKPASPFWAHRNEVKLADPTLMVGELQKIKDALQ